MSLLLHEYLGLALIEDRKYEISGKFLELYSLNVANNIDLKIFMEKEVSKDLQGQSSCFNGLVKNKSDEIMLRTKSSALGNGLGSVEVQIINSFEVINKASDCQKFLDQQGRETTEKNLAVSKLCRSTGTSDYMVTVPFTHFGHGKALDEAILFKVEEVKETTIQVKIDDDFAVLGSQVKGSVRASYKCTPIQFDQ
jgi:hypothetical protein